MSRNASLDALFALGTGLTPPGGSSSADWGCTGRRWQDYTKSPLPALWQIDRDTPYGKSDHGQLTKRKQQVFWVVVHNTGKDSAAVPSVATNDFMDRVDARLTNQIHRQTLNGNCYAAYIDGSVQRYPGDADGIEIIVVPITIEF